MQIEMNVKKTFDVKYLHMVLPVKYDEEDMPNDFPFRRGEIWEVTIDVDTGQILDWPQGVSRDLYMKVRDGGRYQLLDSDRRFVAIINCYVPHSIVPGDYGDYVDLNIDATGKITNWKPDPSEIPSDFGGEE